MPYRPGRFSRRKLLLASLLLAPLVATAEAAWIEPNWIRTRRIRLGPGPARKRLVHFTDIHYKGERAGLESVVRKINALSPDLVCFTGDLIEEEKHLAEALEILGGIKSPLYGIPGNHDYWSNVPFDGIARCFERTGGAWLLDQKCVTPDGQLTLAGSGGRVFRPPDLTKAQGTRTIWLVHYPAWVDKLPSVKVDLILAGHSHGGQVRLPFFGPLIVPFDVTPYDMGLYQTRAGPLYVNPGIGWFPLPLRFNCRPELTVFEFA